MTIQANQGFGVSVFGGGGGSTSPGGSSGQVQYNNGGSFGGMSGTTWTDASQSLAIASTGTGTGVTTSSPVLNLTQTWNAGAVTFTGLKFNATDTASASASLLIDLQVGGSSKFKVDKAGNVTAVSDTVSVINATSQISLNNTSIGFTNSAATLANNIPLGWSSSGVWYGTVDTFIRRAAAATLQLGDADAAAPVAQTFKVQRVVAGTSNTAGANFTIQGSQGTGTGAGGSIIFQVAPAGSSGTAQNAYVTAMGLNAVAGSSPYAIFEVGAASGYLGFQIRTSGYTGGACFVGDTPTQGTVFGVHPAFAFAWANNNATPTVTYDLFVRRDAANTLALRNGTNAQRFNVYNTYTSSTNYETFKIDWITTANTCLIGTEKGSGGGTARELALQTDGTTRWVVASDGPRLRAPVSSGDASVGHLESNNDLYLGASAGSTLGLRGYGDTIILIDAGNSYSDKVFSVRNNSNAFGSATTILTARENGSVIIGNLSSALATTATDGFLYIPTCAGTPTGTPTTQTGTAPIVVDTTNNKLYFYSGGQWRDAGP